MIPRVAMPIVCAVICSGLSGVACSSAGIPMPPAEADGEPDPMLMQGRRVYADRCANCHGIDGRGGQGPALAQGSVVEAYPVIADQIDLVSDGYRLMPSFRHTLTRQQIEAVVRFTREVL